MRLDRSATSATAASAKPGAMSPSSPPTMPTGTGRAASRLQAIREKNKASCTNVGVQLKYLLLDGKIGQAIAHEQPRIFYYSVEERYTGRRLGVFGGYYSRSSENTRWYLRLKNQDQDQVRTSLLVLARLQRKQTIEVLQCSGEAFVGSILNTAVPDCFLSFDDPNEV